MGSPRPPGHAALPLANWPAADRSAYERACVPGNPFDEGGQAARWRPATHRALTRAYARWLGYLLAQGINLDDQPPPNRVTPKWLGTYTRFLLERCACVTVSSYLGQLHMMLRDVWPEVDWQWVNDLQARYHRMAEPSRNKAARIVPQQELLRLGCELMRQAETLPLSANMTAGPMHPALLYRDGLLIALLAMRPLRQRNMLGLQIGHSLRRDGEGWEIRIPAQESKTHMALNMAFPTVLLPALETYLAIYRPLLLAMRGPIAPNNVAQPAGFHLWVTRCGTAMSAGSLQKALARHTKRRFGHHVNVHLFRDCAASSLAEDDPLHVELAAELLGHRSFQTTYNHYITATQRSALRRCQANIINRRKSARHDAVVRKKNRLEEKPLPVIRASRKNLAAPAVTSPDKLKSTPEDSDSTT